MSQRICQQWDLFLNPFDRWKMRDCQLLPASLATLNVIIPESVSPGTDIQDL